MGSHGMENMLQLSEVIGRNNDEFSSYSNFSGGIFQELLGETVVLNSDTFRFKYQDVTKGHWTPAKLIDKHMISSPSWSFACCGDMIVFWKYARYQSYYGGSLDMVSYDYQTELDFKILKAKERFPKSYLVAYTFNLFNAHRHNNKSNYYDNISFGVGKIIEKIKANTCVTEFGVQREFSKLLTA